ncbi:hypothetical protein HMPREF1548_04878 [Clostridium sp. KLE 1755]|nr:hypothetical protein HMPREF1548_04878 [Clostridium sp. KLE 1755]
MKEPWLSDRLVTVKKILLRTRKFLTAKKIIFSLKKRHKPTSLV